VKRLGDPAGRYMDAQTTLKRDDLGVVGLRSLTGYDTPVP
jgi:hypothetical protein